MSDNDASLRDHATHELSQGVSALRVGIISAVDFVNDFFRSHYPSDAETNWDMEYCVGGYERRYQGGSRSTIFPLFVCADGLSFSVQGHFGAYSSPRGDFEREYWKVEILGPKVPEFEAFHGDDVGDQRLYGYVPVKIVNAVIAAYGGPAKAMSASGQDAKQLEAKPASAAPSGVCPKEGT